MYCKKPAIFALQIVIDKVKSKHAISNWDIAITDKDYENRHIKRPDDSGLLSYLAFLPSTYALSK
jgi:hypothetical protein